MKVIETKSAASSLVIAAGLITGRGSNARTVALFEIAPAAMNAEQGKAHFTDVMNKALAGSTDKALVKLVRQEAIVGIATIRMPAGEFPRGCSSPEQRMNFVRMLYTSYTAPDVVNLGKNQKGRRTEKQHRALRNAEQRAATYLAELGAGNAQTDKQSNAKRQTKGSQSQTAAKQSNAPSHSELVSKPPKPADRDAAMLFITQQARMLQDYANKNAKVLPTDAGTAVAQFLKSMNAANNAEQERKARIAAKPAAPAKA